MGRRLVLTGILAAAAATLAWFALRNERPAASSLAPATTVADVMPEPGAALEPAVERGGVRADAREVATLELLVRGPDGRPLPESRIELLAAAGRNGSPQSLSTAGDGTCRVEVASGVALIARPAPRFDVDGRRVLHCPERSIPALRAGEERAVTLDFELGCERLLETRFLDRATRRPLERGAVRILELGSGVCTIRPVPSGPCAEVDRNGRLELCLALGRFGPCLFESPGWSPVIFEPEEVTRLREILVDRSASLEVIVTERAPRAGNRLVVELSADSWLLVPRDERGERCCLPPGGRYVASMPVSTDGVAHFADLPSDVPFELHAERDGRSVYTHHATIAFAAEERGRLEIEFGAGRTELVVDVVDQSLGGRAVGAGNVVGLVRGGIEAGVDEDRALVPSSAPPKFELRGKTDDHGRVVFSAVSEGTWWVASAVVRAPWDDESATALTPVAQRIRIAAEDVRRELTLRTWSGLYIRGRVEVPDGRLFPPDATADTTPNMIFLARASDGGGGLTGQPKPDGTFSIGPVTDGEYVITTSARGYAPIEPVRARASDGPIVIRMQLGSAIRGRVFDPASGASVACDFVVSRVDAVMDEISGSTNDTGEVGSNGLAAGEYVISAVSSDGRSGASRRVRVRAGEEIQGVDVPLTPLAELGRVRIVLEGSLTPGRVTLWKDGACRAFHFVGAGAVIDAPMPEGACELRLHAGDALVERRDVEVSRGKVTEVRVRR